MKTFLPFAGSPGTPVNDAVTAPYSSAIISEGAISAGEVWGVRGGVQHRLPVDLP